MDKRANIASSVAACVLMFVNILAMVSCVLLFALALWIISSPSTLSYAIDAMGTRTIKALVPQDNLTLQLGVGLAALAMFVFFLSLMGLYGTITRSPFQLFMYSSLVFLLMLLECALLFYFSTNLLEKGIQERDGAWAHATRLFFACCERNATFSELNERPWSCCGAPNNCTAQTAYTQDCESSIAGWFEGHQTAMYVCVVVLHVVLSSCSLIRRASASRSHS